MKQITLNNIKRRKLNKYYWKELHDTWELSDNNIQCYRYRMENNKIEWNIQEMLYDGNDPRSIEDVLDLAKCYYKANVYTDEEWKKYFIPAINKHIEKEENFERWQTGYLIQNKEGTNYIVEYDYATAFGGRDFTSLAVLELDENRNPVCEGIWRYYGDYQLIDKDNQEKYIKIIRKYHNRKKDSMDIPMYMNDELAEKINIYGT